MELVINVASKVTRVPTAGARRARKEAKKNASGTDKRTCFKCKKVGHLKKDCLELNDKKDDGMFLGMLECLEVKQGEAEPDDHFAALFDCSVFLESNEAKQSSAQALLDESTVGTNQGTRLMKKSLFRSYGMDNKTTLVAKEKKKQRITNPNR